MSDLEEFMASPPASPKKNLSARSAGAPDSPFPSALTISEPLRMMADSTSTMTLNLQEYSFIPVSESQTPTAPQTPAQANSLKRGLPTDITEYAMSLSRNVRLKPANHEELALFAQAPPERQSVWTAAQLLVLSQRLDVLQPVDAPFVINASLSGKIEVLSAKTFLDSTASAYLTVPNTKVMDALKRLPELKEALGSKPSMQIISSKVSSRFTHHRNNTKDEIGTSLGHFNSDTKTFVGPYTGIVALTRALVASIGKSNEIPVTIPLVVRVAFWRHVYVAEAVKTLNGKPGPDFWKAVDEGLKKIREAKDNDAARISAVFSKVLENDRTKYTDQGQPEDAEIQGLLSAAGTGAA
ncbi:hypothetical protein D9758_007947 [Tetrapyrgos nigripes]|uniref:Uncharacterized protein n=1 Tax=Tetrapyrgos nigripes TaxID=182062 RepID=A0A8H5D563_9AGAR|nr:hypothetical protein D9758_007947 [Tetrapyrgos nigripes]